MAPCARFSYLSVRACFSLFLFFTVRREFVSSRLFVSMRPLSTYAHAASHLARPPRALACLAEVGRHFYVAVSAIRKSGRPAHFSDRRRHRGSQPPLPSNYHRHPPLCRFPSWRSKPSPRSSLVLSLSFCALSLSLSLPSRSHAYAFSFYRN